MRTRVRAWLDVHRVYNRLRTRYFLDAEPPLKVPPLAKELRWLWGPDNFGAVATTDLDEDWDPHTVTLHPALKRLPLIVLKATLIHELIHMRVPYLAHCNPTGTRPSKGWRMEAMRLTSLGAVAEIL